MAADKLDASKLVKEDKIYRLSEEMKETIIRKSSEGYRRDSIAEAAGVHVSTVNRIIRDHKVKGEA